VYDSAVAGRLPPWPPGALTLTDADQVIRLQIRCSAKGCHASAVWALRWNNPKLHDPDRRKTWLACDDHRGPLSEFLGARGFLREVAEL
jgi:hypothetical protein